MQISGENFSFIIRALSARIRSEQAGVTVGLKKEPKRVVSLQTKAPAAFLTRVLLHMEEEEDAKYIKIIKQLLLIIKIVKFK